MPDNRRHTEFFGADLGRGPVLSGAPAAAAVQLAAMLAQLRTPLTRSDDALREHADFIRELADRLFPDFASALQTDVLPLSAGQISTVIRTTGGSFSLLECWLADGVGAGLTATAPTNVTWSPGVVLAELVAKKHYLVITPDTGTVQAAVAYAATKSWRWAIVRSGRIYYSDSLNFP